MGGYPTSCEEVLADLQARHQPFIENGWSPIPIGENVKLHRLVREQDIDINVGKPSKSSFSNYGLSVLVESSTYSLDIEKELQNDDRFVGAVSLDAEYVQALGYEIHLDPHPDPLGHPQHPNHAQIVCKKTQGNTKKMRDQCIWSFCPSCLPPN